ncbi:hypothetical protein [Burkholderia stagnalis]|uniref:hypothetical protein n=1 Tax=Burkholderia stagnalis TaxID=1503054 RepID=UPI000AA496B0|nr:hypothetical protein [Burkholderia stagnalis]
MVRTKDNGYSWHEIVLLRKERRSKEAVRRRAIAGRAVSSQRIAGTSINGISGAIK